MHGDILEYISAGTTVRAWTRGQIPEDILIEVDLQRKLGNEKRNREIEALRSKQTSSGR